MFARAELTFTSSPRDVRQEAQDEVRSPAHTFLTCEDETLALWPRGASPTVPGTMARSPEGECADLGPGPLSWCHGGQGQGQIWAGEPRPCVVHQGSAWSPAARMTSTPLFPSCVTLGKCGNLSELQYPPLQNADENSPFLAGCCEDP